MKRKSEKGVEGESSPVEKSEHKVDSHAQKPHPPFRSFFRCFKKSERERKKGERKKERKKRAAMSIKANEEQR